MLAYAFLCSVLFFSCLFFPSFLSNFPFPFLCSFFLIVYQNNKKKVFELHGRTLLSYAPACTVFRGSLSFTPGAAGRAPSFWLPLAGYARQHPERQEWRAVPALDNRRIYVNFCGGGDGGRVRLECCYNQYYFFTMS